MVDTAFVLGLELNGVNLSDQMGPGFVVVHGLGCGCVRISEEFFLQGFANFQFEDLSKTVK